jgi:hypothetical protein
MSQEEKIKARVYGRQQAAAAYDLILLSDGTPPWFDGHGADFAEAFIEKMAELLPKRRTDAPAKEPLPPIARLGAVTLNFGQHKGLPLDEIPLDYLDWLCRTYEDLVKDLKAYLTHPELKSRRQ